MIDHYKKVVNGVAQKVAHCVFCKTDTINGKKNSLPVCTRCPWSYFEDYSEVICIKHMQNILSGEHTQKIQYNKIWAEYRIPMLKKWITKLEEKLKQLEQQT
jgi:hypothetical protein